jgi:trigger factor
VRQAHTEHETVERPAQLSDQLLADVAGVSDGETVVDRKSATLDLTDALEPAGFAEALVGMSAGESRTFSLTYPEDYADDKLAGKNVVFTVAVTTVRETRVPEANDDLAKMAGDYETLEQLRETLASNLRVRLENEARRRETDAAVSALAGQAEIVYPAVALENEITSAINRQKSQLQQIGFTFENYLRMIGKTEAELREQVRPDAEKSLLQRLAVIELARAEGLKVTPEDLNTALQQFQASVQASYGAQAPQVLQRLQEQGVAYSLFNDALIDKALRHARALLTGRTDELQYAPAEEAAESDHSTESAQAEG